MSDEKNMKDIELLSQNTDFDINMDKRFIYNFDSEEW